MSASFDDVISAIGELESQEFLEGMAKEMSAVVEDLVEKGFQTATDPYGNPWAPRKLAEGRRQPPHLPLRKTYQLHDSFRVESSAQGVKVTNPVAYAPFINDGTRNMDARAMLPGEKGLGDWEEPLREAARDYLNSKLGEGG